MAATTTGPMELAASSRILVPIRYRAWLSGTLGHELLTLMTHSLAGIPQIRVDRLPGGFLIEAEEDPGPLLEAVRRAAAEMEDAVAARYPMFLRQMGSPWTGTLQVVFTDR